MMNLAAARYAMRDLDGARELAEQAVGAYRRMLGEQHPQTREWEQAMARREPPDEAPPAGEAAPG
jgi:hypothetical protein